MIFCVEDDRGIRELIVYALENSGLPARGLADGVELLTALKTEKPTLILLDIMLPGRDGLSLLQQLRRDPSMIAVPIIMVTARSSEIDKVKGLNGGADDYIAKPFGVMEMVARVRAVLRRMGTAELPEQRLVCGAVMLDVSRHTVTVDGTDIVLTHKEFELLQLLMENSGRVLSRDRLLETVWGYEFSPETRTLDVHIRSLRQKLGHGGDIVETVRGIGYRVCAKREEDV